MRLPERENIHWKIDSCWKELALFFSFFFFPWLMGWNISALLLCSTSCKFFHHNQPNNLDACFRNFPFLPAFDDPYLSFLSVIQHLNWVWHHPSVRYTAWQRKTSWALCGFSKNWRCAASSRTACWSLSPFSVPCHDKCSSLPANSNTKQMLVLFFHGVSPGATSILENECYLCIGWVKFIVSYSLETANSFLLSFVLYVSTTTTAEDVIVKSLLQFPVK